MRSGCARAKITWTARTVSQNTRSNFSPPSCAITLTALVCSIGIVGQLFGDTVEKERGRNERSEARAWWSRHQADQSGKTWQVALLNVVVVQSSSSLISCARYDRKTWPAFVQLHAPPFPPKVRYRSCGQLRVRPVAFGSRLGHCPVVMSLARSSLFMISASNAMATRRVLGRLGTRKRSHGCVGAATPETLGRSRSANGQGRIRHVTWFIRVRQRRQL